MALNRMASMTFSICCWHKAIAPNGTYPAACIMQVIIIEHLWFASNKEYEYARRMIYEPKQCPFRFGLGVFGDRWSLLIIRDMMFRGSTRFQDFLDAGEGISTNVLSDRLGRLEAQRIISRRKDPANGRRVLYHLTEKGEDLLPVMLAVVGWAEKYDQETRISGEIGERIRTDLSGFLDDVLAVVEHSGSEAVLPLLFGESGDAQINSPEM